MDRFLKRTEHPVSPVFTAPKNPKVSSKQGVMSHLCFNSKDSDEYYSFVFMETIIKRTS